MFSLISSEIIFRSFVAAFSRHGNEPLSPGVPVCVCVYALDAADAADAICRGQMID